MALRYCPSDEEKKTKRIALIFGTRPEAIKLCPVALAMKDHPGLEPRVCVTGQHRQMLDQVLEVFGVAPDVDLALMRPDQGLGAFTARAIAALDAYLAEDRPDLVLVQGDTTTAFCAALAAYYHRTPVGHVEAGLRTWRKFSPFPEEINRVLTTRLADYHFAPTQWAADNLLREGVAPEKVFVTGNTVIDALHIAMERVRRHPPQITGLPPELLNGQRDRRVVLITGHRRENFGDGFQAICQAVGDLARRFPDVAFVYPVHLNPNVRRPVFGLLGDRPNVHLIEPLPYVEFVALMDRSCLILTDSGGVQEEAPSLGKPVLVMRDTTERPEGVQAGVVKLVGADADRITAGAAALLESCHSTTSLLGDPPPPPANPYGDGRAAERIIKAILHECRVVV